jgi:hypothetical protein
MEYNLSSTLAINKGLIANAKDQVANAKECARV